MAQKVGRHAGLAVGFEIGGRCNHSEAAGRTDRNRNHVARHKVGASQAKVEPVGNDIHDPSLGDEIDMDLGIATQELQQKRTKNFPRSCCECVDPKDSGRGFLLRAGGPHRIVKGLYGRPDLIDEVPSSVRQGDTAGRAVEQSDAELAFQLANGVAQRGCRQAKVQCGSTERSAPRNGENSIKFDQAMLQDCPAFRNATCRFSPVIGNDVYR